MARSYVFVALVLFVTSSVFSAALSSSKIKAHEWDYLVFTQAWPQVTCLSWEVQSHSHKCNLTKDVDTWTVHGIWPSSSKGDFPSFCNNSRPFNMSQIQSIRPSLTKYWPNLYAHTPEDQLWEHEWNKHGTCAAALPQLANELLFFDKGVALAKKYNMLGILKMAGILPSAETPVVAYDIEKAVKKALGVKPNLVCEYVSKNKTWYISEIEVCFSKKLQMINCPTNSLERLSVLGNEKCPSSELVWYPPLEYTDQQLFAKENYQGHQIPFVEKLLKNVLTLIYILL